MSSYKVLNKQIFRKENFEIVPIRFEDRYKIMKWRNEQIFHLRQLKNIEKKEQDDYFKNVVSKLFEDDKPQQILFSYLENGKCIGYGGLVHINWNDKNAEISFVLNTNLENKFIENWIIFLFLIEKVGFDNLNFNKLFTYAFDLRPKLYTALDLSGYTKEAILVNQTFFNDKYIDVIIHSKFKNNKFILRRAESNYDALKLYEWVNDFNVRENSINTKEISVTEHFKWFNEKVKNDQTEIYILTDLYNSYLGQVRLDKFNDNFEIDYSISKLYRGRGYGNMIIKLLLENTKNINLIAKVKKTNIASIKIFLKNEFILYTEENDLLYFIKKVSA
jgi:RimJ/RimL family protein N-acetyltransferase